MRASNISFRQLKAFVALVEQRNFTRAAEQCHLSQPAFSALIQMFEQSAGVKLFDRTTRNVELTQAGQLLEAWARRMLDDFDTAFEQLADYVAIRKGRAAVAVSPSLASNWLPPIVADYHRAHPGVALELFDCLADDAVELVRSGKADFALTALTAIDADLEAEPLLDDPFRVVCRNDHPLAGASALRLSDLQGTPFLNLVRSSNTRQLIDSALQEAGVPVLVEVVHLSTLIGLVSAGMGVSILPAYSLARFESSGLVTVPLVEPRVHRSFLIVRARGRSLSAAAEALLDSVRQHSSELRGPELQP